MKYIETIDPHEEEGSTEITQEEEGSIQKR
jgi:hypothetical protein